jgi:hypothetical protein
MWQIMRSAVQRPAHFVDEEADGPTLLALAVGASAGITLYGGVIHAAEGVGMVIASAGRALLTAGTAWALSIPALVVISALLGSKVPWRRAVQASLITVNFGGLAFLASIPVVVLLELSSPFSWTRPLIHAAVVVGVGGCSTLIFERTMARLEGRKLFHVVWMGVFGLLFVEIAWLIDLFRFTA